MSAPEQPQIIDLGEALKRSVEGSRTETPAQHEAPLRALLVGEGIGLEGARQRIAAMVKNHDIPKAARLSLASASALLARAIDDLADASREATKQTSTSKETSR